MSVEMAPGPDGEHHHHQHTGHRWLDITLAVSAVFISLVSLFLAIQHGRVMEKMVEASTWAFVTVDFSNADRDFKPHTRLMMINKGVGPARIENLEVFYNGVAEPGPHALVAAILKRDEPKSAHGFFTSDIRGTVLSAKEELDFLDFNADSYSPDEYQAVSRAMSKLDFRVCYCSVLDECWLLDNASDDDPHSVANCNPPNGILFRG